MDGLKPDVAKQSFWCGILNKESAAAAPASRTRTVRGPYTAFTGSDNTDKNGARTGQGTRNGDSEKNRKT